MSPERVLKLHEVEAVPLREGGHAMHAARVAHGRLGVGAERRQRVEGGQGLEAVGRGVLLQQPHGPHHAPQLVGAQGPGVLAD